MHDQKDSNKDALQLPDNIGLVYTQLEVVACRQVVTKPKVFSPKLGYALHPKRPYYKAVCPIKK